MAETRFWIGTVSRAHVLAGVAGGFTQAGHGARRGLARLQRGDWLAFYSPRTALRGGEPLQAFTAIGRIDDDEPYRATMTPDFHPWRRAVAFLECAETPIRPLLGELEFIPDGARWGLPFRRGLFPIGRSDAEFIGRAMGAQVPLGNNGVTADA